MEQHSQDPATLAPDDLSQYATVGDWLDQHAGAFFETRASLDWFVKRNRQELIECGALLPRHGRAGSLVSVRLMSTAVLKILRRQALERAA